MRNAVTAAVQPSSRSRKRLQKDHIRLYLLFLPVAVWYIIFQYVPMGGLVIAFQDFKILKGIGASKFVGFDNFVYLFSLPRSCRPSATRSSWRYSVWSSPSRCRSCSPCC